MNKRGQREVVIFIIAIAIFTLVYLVLLNYQDKCVLLPNLPECNSSYGSSGNASENLTEAIILSVEHGKLSPVKDYATYKIDSAELYSRDEVDYALEIPYTEVSNTWGNAQSIDSSFSKNPDTSKVQLMIGISKSRGSLYVYVNGKKIETITGTGIKIIDLSLSSLQDDNTITLKASTPVLPIKNYYELSFVKIRQSYSEVQNKVTREVEIEEDIDDIKSAELHFKSDCGDKPLNIDLNGKNVFTETTCGERIVLVDDLQQANTLKLSSEGDYFVYDMHLKTKMIQDNYPIYYFTLSSARYAKIRDGQKFVMLKLDFADLEYKNITMLINGREFYIETSKAYYQVPINDYLKKGVNSVRILSDKSLIVVKMEITEQ